MLLLLHGANAVDQLLLLDGLNDVDNFRIELRQELSAAVLDIGVHYPILVRIEQHVDRFLELNILLLLSSSHAGSRLPLATIRRMKLCYLLSLLLLLHQAGVD